MTFDHSIKVSKNRIKNFVQMIVTDCGIISVNCKRIDCTGSEFHFKTWILDGDKVRLDLLLISFLASHTALFYARVKVGEPSRLASGSRLNAALRVAKSRTAWLGWASRPGLGYPLRQLPMNPILPILIMLR